MIFIYSESPYGMMQPNKFLSKRIYGLEKLFEKFQEVFLLHDHLLYLSEMKEAFMSLFFGLKHLIKFLLMRTYGFDEDVV